MSVGTTDLPAGLGGFTAGTAGSGIHHVRGGSGPPLVLLHGFPQCWYEWRHVMPRLAERFTVVAVDLPGVGGSAPSPTGYAAQDLAGAVHRLVEALDLGPVHLVGHDVGGCVAYAYARAYPGDTRSVAVLEVPIPGIGPEPDAEPATPPAASLWHGGFHQTPDLPEALVNGREAVYFRYFFDTFTAADSVISDADLAHYVAAYGDPARLHAAFEWYRAMPASAAYNLGRTEPIGVPLLLVGGEHLFGPIMPGLADRLRVDHGWSDVRVHVVPGAMHYLVEERPEQIAQLVERHAGAVRPD